MALTKPKSFDPNSDEHLQWALKLAYLHVYGDMDISSEEAGDALCDALCNLIGVDAFCEFTATEV